VQDQDPLLSGNRTVTMLLDRRMKTGRGFAQTLI